MSVGALADLRVLDLSRHGGAGFCSRLLAQLGADVEARAVAGVASLEQIVGRHDLLILDVPQPEARALGLTPDRFQALGQVAVSVTPFGLDGADAEHPLATSILDGVRANVVDALAGAHAAVAALAALRWARPGRRGILVEVAAVEVVASCPGEGLPRTACPLRVRDAVKPDTDRAPLVVPCADGYVGLAAMTAVDRQLLAAMTDIDTVRAEAPDLGRLLARWLQARTRAEVFRTAQLWRLPVAPVLKPNEVRQDEQSLARGVWGHGADVVGGPARSPFRFSWASGSVERSARPAPRPLSDLRVLDLGMVWAGWGADGRPHAAPVAYLDYLAGVYGAVGVLAALLARDRNGRGAHVEIAQREVACQIMPSSPYCVPTFAVDPALVATDPHLVTRGLFAQPGLRARSCHHYARLPWRLHGIPSRRERGAPAFGGQTRRILRETLGLADLAIDRLARDRVVALSRHPGAGPLS